MTEEFTDAPQVRGAPAHALFLSLLVTQGLWVSRRTERMPEAEGPREGQTGDSPELSLLALGDSIIAGVGVSQTRASLPVQLALKLAAATETSISWTLAGRNGRRSGGLVRSLDRLAAPEDPSMVLLSNGINDVTKPIRAEVVFESITEAIKVMEQRFPKSLIFQLGLPPLESFPALPWPLSQVLGRRSDAVDHALAAWIAPRPGTIHLPFSESISPGEFALDGYHPDEVGVERWARHLVPDILPHLNQKTVRKTAP